MPPDRPIRSPMVTMTRQFVSRKTGHPLGAGYEPMDFRDWYYPARKDMRQILAIGYDQQPAGESILVTYQPEAPKRWIDAAVEHQLGNGRVIACALNLEDGALEDNPIARDFLQRMPVYLAAK